MRNSRLLLILPLVLIAVPAAACPPPIPGAVEPPPRPKAEVARSIASWSTEIAYGVVTNDGGDRPRFKIIHVYKGALKPGQVIRPRVSWGFDRPPCFGMSNPPPVSKGDYGVIAYSTEPELSFVPDDILTEMFKTKLIVSAKPRPRA